MENAITLTKVGRIFPDGKPVTALHDISLAIKPGEFFICVGLSGSGKSTLLRIMSGLDRPTTGTVELGAEIKSTDLSFVFQQFALFPWLTVYQNVELGLIARGVPEQQRRDKVTAELATFGLSELARALPRQLSGGQRQRVGIARAIVTDPKIIFMDEPFSELDSLTAEQLRQDLLQLWSKRKFTIVMVTHLLQEAVELADRIAVLPTSPGPILHLIDNAISRPRDLRTPEAFSLEDELRSYLLS